MLSNDIAISVRSLSKSYFIAHDEERHNTLAEAMLSRLKTPLKRQKKEAFWALKDVSFDIRKGDVVGIIGRNGAGKSTLLKILSRITEPTAGEIDLYGRVGSLLEVGTGFSGELSGRENIFLNGAILGMSKAEIKKQFDAIVDFSGVEKFLDTPVKRYSSGMYVRLAFAVAAHLEPEILIVDEVLAVGDAQFQDKCLGKMKDVAGKGRTVLFVSHNMAAITTLCTRAVYMAKGSVVATGSVKSVSARYIEAGRESMGEKVWDLASAPGNEKLQLVAVRIISNDEVSGDVEISRDVEVHVMFRTLQPGLRVATSIHLLDRVGTCILATINVHSATTEPDPMFNRPHILGTFNAVCKIPANFLNDGTYSISAFLLTDVSNIEVIAQEAVRFTVHETGDMRKEHTGGWIGLIRPKLWWRTASVESYSNGRFEIPLQTSGES